jgi:hypothetical protein
VKFYTNDGAGGEVNYSSAIATVYVRQSGPNFTALYKTISYGETERLFGAIAYSTSDVASRKATEATITPDATPLDEPTGVQFTEGRD